jgi:hypothetical protein
VAILNIINRCNNWMEIFFFSFFFSFLFFFFFFSFSFLYVLPTPTIVVFVLYHIAPEPSIPSIFSISFLEEHFYEQLRHFMILYCLVGCT